jgi:nucleotide-binding universal stress UspA family protein
MKPKLILAPVDFSTGSRAALEHAARLALQQGARLHVLHIIDSYALATLADRRGEAFESAARHSLEHVRKALDEWLGHTTLPTDLETTVVLGAPVHEILEHTKNLGADLLVAGVAGAGGHADGAGSVAAKLARKSVSDVLLVRAGHPQVFSKIVAALDFSGHSARVRAAAFELAMLDSTAAEVDLLHVWADPGSMLPVMGPFGESGLSLSQAALPPREELLRSIHHSLQLHAAEAPPGLKVHEIALEHRKAAEGIAEHARASQADVLVIGSLGHTNLRYLLLGSTAERLLARTPCSLLVVKPQAA